MIGLEEFDEITSRNFSYLLDLGFGKSESERGYAMYYVSYSKNDLVVRIEYSIKNDYVNATIVQNPTKPQDFGNDKCSVFLSHLMHKYQPNYDYQRDYLMIMPKEIGMAQSMEAVAMLFRQYAMDILLGKKWESWGDITGYKQPKSPEINVYHKGKLIVHKPKED
jgi:hypothetical protein